MTSDAIGQICALAAAMTWALALICFRKSGERVHPLALNLFKNVVGIAMIVATLGVYAAVGISDVDSDVAAHANWRERIPASDYYLLIISGFLGIAVADTLLFRCLNMVGVGMFVIVECTYSPITLLVAWWVLSEKLEWPHFIGGALILIAILLTVGAKPSVDRTRRDVVVGFILGILYIFLMAIGIVLAKPVFAIDGFPLLEATVIRLLAGTAALALMTAASPRRAELFSVFIPSSVWKYTVPGAILGGYLSMVFWIAGFKYTDTGVAAILNQTSVVFAAVLAVALLKEKMTRRRVAGVTLAFVGVLVVRMGPALSQWFVKATQFG